MKLKVLGNNGPYPSVGGACSAYLLTSDSGNTRLLIECGTGMLSMLQREASFDSLSAVILSHLHFDHMSDILPMQYALQFHPRSPLPVYAPRTPENVRALLNAPCYAPQDISDAQIGEMKISVCPVRHPVETYALRIECDGRVFTYTGDTNEIEILDSFCAGADLLLADAGLSSEHWSINAPHLSARGCGELAQRAGVKKLLLTHLNPRYTPEQLVEEAKAAFPNCEFTNPGSEYAV
ncbi:MAG: MBL fold metallo-hydrolase [Clostridia bacterium]|nr:MBL fold metallo-hydrolase [Clostridia bacterium]